MMRLDVEIIKQQFTAIIPLNYGIPEEDSVNLQISDRAVAQIKSFDRAKEC